jgi:hypothetical protein
MKGLDVDAQIARSSAPVSATPTLLTSICWGYVGKSLGRRAEPRGPSLWKCRRTNLAEQSSRFDDGSRASRIHRLNDTANRFAGFSASMRERRRRDPHAPELAQLRRDSPPGGGSRSVRNHVRRRPRQHPRFFPSERSERVRRESDRRCHSECVRERHQVDPEHDDSGQWRRARLCVYRCAERYGQSVGEQSRRPANRRIAFTRISVSIRNTNKPTTSGVEQLR